LFIGYLFLPIATLEGSERVTDQDIAWLSPDVRGLVTALFASR